VQKRGQPDRARLRSWKEIAGFFGTDERTAKRWEASRGLPVHRVPGGARPTVYAERAELEQWLKSASADAPKTAPKPVEAPPPLPPAPQASPERAPSRRRSVLLAALLLVGGAAAGFALFQPILPWAEPAAHRPSPEAVELYLAGMYHWEKRTGASLTRAAALFREAIARDPDYAEPHAGLANTYLLLREYAGMADEVAYPRAMSAAERALALDPRLADGHLALAFATFYWLRDFTSAERSFRRAIELAPASARGRHWYATALLHMGEFGRAQQEIEAARRLQPESRAILADRALILFHAGRRQEAETELRRLSAAEPDFLSPHNYLATIHLSRGDHVGWLSEELHLARAVGNQERVAMLEAAGDALRREGRRAMLHEMLRRQRVLRREGRITAYELAGTLAMLGERRAALDRLGEALSAREPATLELRIDPAFVGLRADPEFRRLVQAFGSGSGPA